MQLSVQAAKRKQTKEEIGLGGGVSGGCEEVESNGVFVSCERETLEKDRSITKEKEAIEQRRGGVHSKIVDTCRERYNESNRVARLLYVCVYL